MNILPRIIPRVLGGDAKLQTNFLVGLLLTALIASFSVGVTVYNYSIFLSTYSVDFIPWWMLAESLAMFLLGNILSLFSPHNFQQYTRAMMLIALGIIIGVLILGYANWYWGPFTIVLLLRTASVIISTSVWSLLSTFFYFRQFKFVINKFTISSSLAAILTPMLLAGISMLFGPRALLIFLALSLVCGIVAISKTKTVINNIIPRDRSHEDGAQVSAFQYPLFRSILFISLILAILYNCSDFIFKMQMGLALTREEITVFMSGFLAVSNLVALLIQILAPEIFARLKFYLILQLVFVIIALAAALYQFLPSLWPAVILGATGMIFEYSLIGMIRRNVINIFPPVIINKCEIYVKTWSTAIGTVIAALLALFSTHVKLLLQYFPLVFILLALIGIISAGILFRQYLQTLKKMVIITGFSDAAENNLEDIQKLVQQNLSKVDVNPLEISLVTPKLFEEPPTSLYRILKQSENEDIKTVILRILQQYSHEKLDFPALTELYRNPELLSDHNREIILKLLSQTHSRSLLEEIRATFQDDRISKNTLMFLLKHGDTEDYMYALDKTLIMAGSMHADERMIAAKLLDTLGAGRFYDLKSRLLTDEDPLVRIVAFHHLPARDVELMLPSLGKFLNRNVIRTLHSRFEPAELTNLAHHLMELYHESQEEYALSTMAFVVPIPDQRLEKYVMEFLRSDNTFHRSSLSRDLIARKRQVTISDKLKKTLFTAMQYELALVREYRRYLYSTHFNQIKHLLVNRIDYAINRFLFWYAAWNEDTAAVYASIAQLTTVNIHRQDKNTRDKVIEFLISNEKSMEIVSMLEEIFDNRSTNVIALKKLDKVPKFKHDPWLTKMLATWDLIEDHTMNPLQRAIALQKTEFFASLPEEVLFELGQSCKLLDVAENETIIEEGDEGDSLYILVQGELWVYKNQNLLATLQPVKCIGEMALFGSGKRTTTVRAHERSLLLVLAKDDFITLTNEFPQILHNIITIIIQRFNDQIAVLEGPAANK